jgi:hypothetical protein
MLKKLQASSLKRQGNSRKKFRAMSHELRENWLKKLLAFGH